jgi:hypothetical protein
LCLNGAFAFHRALIGEKYSGGPVKMKTITSWFLFIAQL